VCFFFLFFFLGQNGVLDLRHSFGVPSTTTIGCGQAMFGLSNACPEGQRMMLLMIGSGTARIGSTPIVSLGGGNRKDSAATAAGATDATMRLNPQGSGEGFRGMRRMVLFEINQTEVSMQFSRDQGKKIRTMKLDHGQESQFHFLQGALRVSFFMVVASSTSCRSSSSTQRQQRQ